MCILQRLCVRVLPSQSGGRECSFIMNTHAHTHAYTHTHINTTQAGLQSQLPLLHAHTHTHTHTQTHKHTNTQTHALTQTPCRLASAPPWLLWRCQASAAGQRAVGGLWRSPPMACLPCWKACALQPRWKVRIQNAPHPTHLHRS